MIKINEFLGLLLWVLSAVFLNNVVKSDNIPDIRKKPYKAWRLKIQCQVCEISTRVFAREAKKLKTSIGKKKITDRDYEDLTSRVCNPYKDEGLWITTYDLVKEPPKLSLVSMGDLGKCNRECETISYTCKKVLTNSAPEIIDVINSNDGKIDNKQLREYICEQPCEKERHDVMKTSKIGGEEWIQTDAEHISLMRMLVEKHEEQSGQKIGGYSMDQLNRMVEQQEQKKQFEQDMKQKRKKRRKRLYGDDYVDPEEEEDEAELVDDNENNENNEDLSVEGTDGQYNHEEL